MVVVVGEGGEGGPIAVPDVKVSGRSLRVLLISTGEEVVVALSVAAYASSVTWADVVIVATAVATPEAVESSARLTTSVSMVLSLEARGVVEVAAADTWAWC